VSEAVREAFPGYRAGVVVGDGLVNGASVPLSVEFASLDHPHLLAWREAFRAFGAKPKRYQCSAEALIRRVDGLPSIYRLVDLYNAVSVTHAVPVGGEDIDRVVGTVRLRFAGDDEVFDGGDLPKPGEVVWADEAGVTCRRWNWRQGVRTRLTESTTRAYFLFDALSELDDASLAAAMDDLSARIAEACPRASLSSFVVG
jgi:DNA/RNA-binding domain of Phe-tRNA-synthetase-like protein